METRNLFAVILSLFSLVTHATTSHQTYQVKKSDTLSEILFRHNIKPLYGPRGSVARTLELNSQSIKKNGNRLLPGQIILLPQTPVVVAPDAVPSPEPVLNEEEATSNFSTRLKAVYFRIDSQDLATKGKTLILSRLSPELALSWDLHWNKNSQFQFTVASFFYTLQKQDDFKYKNQSDTRSSLSATYLNHHKYFSSRFVVAIQEELFPYAQTINELSVEKKFIPYIGVGVIYPIAQKKNAKISAEVGADYLFSHNDHFYNIASGHRLNSAISFSQGRHSLNIFYNLTDQQTTVATKKESQVGLTYGLSFERLK